MTKNIDDMLAKFDDTSINIDKQEEKFVEISSRLSTFEDHVDKSNINKILQPFLIQVNNKQDDKTT